LPTVRQPATPVAAAVAEAAATAPPHEKNGDGSRFSEAGIRLRFPVPVFRPKCWKTETVPDFLGMVNSKARPGVPGRSRRRSVPEVATNARPKEPPMLANREHLAAAVESDPRWASVLARDPEADGAFYYSVRTTGVFCRPSCAARTARPENVAFHPSAKDAE